MYLCRFEAARKLVTPYLDARFAASWQALIPNVKKLIRKLYAALDLLSDASEALKDFQKAVFVKESFIADLKRF